MNKLNWYIYGITFIIIISLSGYNFYLRSNINKLELEIDNQKLLNISKEHNILDLKNIIEDQNKKIKDLSDKQQQAINDYKEWLKKEDKYKQEIKDILNLKGNDTCDTLKKKLELIKVKGYKGL